MNDKRERRMDALLEATDDLLAVTTAPTADPPYIQIDG